VGFKYIGQLIREDKIAMGGEESAGLTMRGHVPEKDGIVACLLVAEMMAARGASISRAGDGAVQEIGARILAGAREFASDGEQKASAMEKSKTDAFDADWKKSGVGDRTDGAKFAFEDGTWMLMRLSGTEPLLRLYVEAESAAASAKLVKDATEWILKG